MAHPGRVVLPLAGTILVFLPLVAPVTFSLALFFTRHIVAFDWLMPAELCIPGLLGSGLVVVSAVRSRMFVRPAVVTAVGSAVCLVASQAAAVILGIASGSRPATGLPVIIVLTCLGAYTVLLAATGSIGIAIVRRS